MPKVKSSLAKQIAELERSVPDFDPEEDRQHHSDDTSGSEDSEDDLAGTEHYANVGKSKLRRPQEVALGPQYAGSKVSRDAAFNDDDDDDEPEDQSEEEDIEDEIEDSDSEDEGEGPFAELSDVDIGEGVGVDDEGEIDSDAAFGDSDEEKFRKFTFRGSGKPRSTKEVKIVNGVKKRPTASDFLSGSDEDDELQGEVSEEDETDEDILDVDAQHEQESGSEGFESEDVDMEGGVALQDGDDSEGESDNESQSGSSGLEVEDDDEDSSEDEDSEDDKARRDELRNLMGEEQKTVAAMSQAAKADAAKGNAVKAQRKTFDSLLQTRMDLQKALVAINSMATVDGSQTTKPDSSAFEGAEEAAIKLWSSLDKLRTQLTKANGGKAGQKRKREADISTPSQELWERMQAHEVAMLDNRQTTLDKWSTKVRGTDAQPISRKLVNPITQQSLTSVLQDQLVNSDHLIQRTKIPRSCAPLQRDAKLVEDPKIFDDAYFYQLLLKELVDQRRVESLNGVGPEVGGAMQWTAVKEIKTRKIVDTKASKGRKMRYNIHEKLQNFMPPEDRGSWESDAIDRFFGTLLGQKMTLKEDEGVAAVEEEVDGEEEGLRLFRS